MLLQHSARNRLILLAGLAASVSAICLPAAPAAAQSAPTREEILRQPLGANPGAPTLEIETEDGIERAPCPLANPEYANVRFTLQGVQFTNAGALDVTTLDDSWRGLVGTEVPIAAICDIRDRAATELRRQGYLAAVRVPVQTIEGGNVTLDILAARLTAIQIRGDAGPSERQMARYLAKLQDQPLFNVHEAERYQLLANSLPGASARLTLRPGTAPGEVVGEVSVSRIAALIDLNVQNYSSRTVGRFGGIVRASINGLTGMGDETTLAAYSTIDFDEQIVLQGGHSFRIGGEGLTLDNQLTYAWTRPELPGGLDFETRTLAWTSQARYPVQLSQAYTLWMSAGFDWIDQDVTSIGTLLNRDHLRVAWAQVDANWIDAAAFSGRNGYSPAEPRWSAGFNFQVRHGVEAFGASRPCGPMAVACFGPGAIPISRIEADPSTLVLRGSANLEWRPVPTITLAIAPRAQYSARPLLSYEEFSAGNFTVGRGYDPGTLTGDSGVAVSSEIRLGSQIPQDNASIAVQPFVFFDAAWVWNEDTAFAGLNPQKLFSVGGGARVVFGNRFRIDFAIAEPLRSTGLVPFRPATRFLISFTTQFGLGR